MRRIRRDEIYPNNDPTDETRCSHWRVRILFGSLARALHIRCIFAAVPAPSSFCTILLVVVFAVVLFGHKLQQMLNKQIMMKNDVVITSHAYLM